MQVNRPVVVSVIGITAITILRYWSASRLNPANVGGDSKPITPVLMGAYVVLLVSAILDIFGGQISLIVGRLCLIALGTTILTQFPWSAVTTWLGTSQKLASK